MKQLIVASLCFFLLAACKKEGSTDTTKSKPTTAFKDTDVINEVKDGVANSSQAQVDLRNITQGKLDIAPKPALSVESIQSVFPETLEGMTKGKTGGETNSIFGYPCTFVSNEYRKGNGIVRVSLTDTGGDPKSLLGLTPWAMKVLNTNETEYYERTRTFGGFPAHERWIHSSQVSNFDYVVDNRWVITLHGRNIPIETIHQIAGFVKPEQLRKLKSQ